jgi:ATP-dependent transcriptional regulator
MQPVRQAIATTKITVPAARHPLVARSRLLDKLDAPGGTFTSICAPAGYGKSTLLAQWARMFGKPCAWLAMDDADNDEIRFWRYAACALAEALPEPVRHRVAELAQSANQVSMLTFLDTLIGEASELSGVTPLILDDYHLIRNANIHDGLSYFIQYLPAGIHLLIASRTPLPFSSAKWSLHGRSAALGMQDLRFTQEEAATLYSGLTDEALPDELLDELLVRTEGWAAGLMLSVHSLRAGAPAQQLLDSFASGQSQVSDYLTNEVLSRLPQEMYRFVLRTSILRRMDAELCEAAAESGNGADLLERLLRMNLFVVPLEEEDGWYRYHHLFAELLSKTLLRQQGRQQWRRLHAQAARHLAERGLLEEAIDYAFEAGEYALAERYMERQLRHTMMRGELATLLRWFESFPESYAISSSMALMHAFIYVLTGRATDAERLLKLLEKRYEAMPPSAKDKEELQSGILFVRSNLLFASGDFKSWLAFAEAAAMDKMAPENEWFYGFNYNTSEPFVRRTSMGLKGVLSEDTSQIGSIFAGALDAGGWSHALINLFVKQSLAEGYYEWNRLDDCSAWLSKVEQPVMARGLPGLVIPHRLTEAKRRFALGQRELAFHAAEEAWEAAQRENNPHWRSRVRAFRIMLHLREGNGTQAKKEAAFLGIDEKDRPTYGRSYEYIALIRLLGKQRKEKEALRLLELLKPQVQREGLVSGIVEICILQALMHDTLMNRMAAMAHLREALTIGGNNGYIRSFTDEGPAMARLLASFKKEQEKRGGRLDPDRQPSSAKITNEPPSTSWPDEAYIERLLQSFPEEEKPVHPALPLPAETLTRSELELLRLLRSGLTNKQIAGETGLSEGTVKVYLSGLYGKLGVKSRTQALIAAQKLEWLAAALD